MIFIKYCVLFGICILSSYIGVIKAKTYESRVENLKKFQSALNMLKSKIEFTHEPINIIFKDISDVIYSGENNIFKFTNSLNNQFYDSWVEAVIKVDNCFTIEDKEIIYMLGKQLRKDKY